MSRYFELRARSAFTFLGGASLPEDLVARAAELGLPGLALSDAGGVYGLPRFHAAARDAGLQALCGAEATIEGRPLLLLCETQAGYKNLCRLLTEGHLRAGRDHRGPGLSWDDLAAHAQGLCALTGAEGHLGAALDADRAEEAAQVLDRLAGVFGPAHLAVELQIHLDPAEDRRNEALVSLARRHRLRLVATNDVRYAQEDRQALCDVLTCTREGLTVDQAGTRLLRNGERHLKGSQEMGALFCDLPEAIDHTGAIAAQCGFRLDQLDYRFPTFPLPAGQPGTAAEFLRAQVAEAAPHRFRRVTQRVRRQLEHELALIVKLKLEGYFLIVWDLVEFCRRRGILVQGRGSAANSAVCFTLGITACDPFRYKLLFERFLSEERGDWPDIDLDLPSQAHREEVIQYLYGRYGQRSCAMTANVITYRLRSALRDGGKALGLPAEPLGKLSTLLGLMDAGEVDRADLQRQLLAAGLDPKDRRVRQLLSLCQQIQDLPRHLGQHPGGMVLARRLDEVVALEPAKMEGRIVLQWDKDDIAAMRLIKIDLLGLGMMAALEEAVRLVPQHDGMPFDLAALPPGDPAVYAMLQQADTVGVFQVESPAQMGVLPRMQPACFYDLVVQVALIRPGPILGDLVHPYLRRRMGEEAVCYPHPSLEPMLRRTLGIPLFQEQVMRVAMTAAGFTGGQAEALRNAMGSKRSAVKMAALVAQLRQGMAERGIPAAAAEQIVKSIVSFSSYGFPESHAISFAMLTYASAYLKAHHPAVFLTSLLNAQPMGFYNVATLVKDAQRRGVRVLSVDVQYSEWNCSIEDTEKPARTVRLGLRYVHGFGKEGAEHLLSVRREAFFASIGDVKRRCPELPAAAFAALAEIGAFASLEGHPTRRSALWQVSALPAGRETLLAEAGDEDGSPLPEMTLTERIQADYRGMGLTVGPHPMKLHREALRARGVRLVKDLPRLESGTAVKVAGVVIARQRPETAKGFLFLSLEDETGLVRIIVAPKDFDDNRVLLATAPALVVSGTLQTERGAVNVKGQRFFELAEVCAASSHDFH